IQSEVLGAIDAFYFCPHLPNEGCRCRKPGLGMIEAALRDFDIDTERSWMVGDKKIDVETGLNAAISTALVLTGYGIAHKALLDVPPTIICANLGEAVSHILASTSAKVVI
ncbi:MAG: HAD-IIIA family hydrolase, partial [Pyrinomonadaceae bacterium]